MKLGDIASINAESANPTKLYGVDAEVSYIDIASVANNMGGIGDISRIIAEDAPSRARRIVKEGNTLLSTVRPNLRAFAYISKLPANPIVSTGFAVLEPKDVGVLTPEYLFIAATAKRSVDQMEVVMEKGSYPSVTQSDVANIKIPLPPLEAQNQIVAELEAEQKLVDANKKLIEIYQQKIKDKLSEIWGKS